MSEYNMPVELSSEELDTVAGGAIDLDIDTTFSKKIEESAQVFSNGEDGTKFASENLTQAVFSQADIDQFVHAQSK
jgi:hypothetical protein